MPMLADPHISSLGYLASTLISRLQVFFFKQKMKKKIQFADWLIELANRGFGLSADAFLKSVKKFLDKEARTIPFKTASQAEVVSEFHHFFNSFQFYYIISQYTILIQISCVSLNKRAFPVRVPCSGHTINSLETVWLIRPC